MEIKASDVKNLREKTGAGMMDCKNALVKTNGDFAAAEKILKELGLAAVEKRADRVTNEGKVFARVSGSKAVLVELACETDFVSRNDDFNAAGEKAADLAIAKGLKAPCPELEAFVVDAASKIKENLSLKSVTFLDAPSCHIASYLHGEGKIGVLVALKSDKAEALGKPEAKALAFDLALHIAAFNPAYLDASKVDPAYLKEQEELFRAQVAKDEKMKAKPANVIDGIIKGKISKHIEEICLLEQSFVKDDKKKVKDVLAETGKALGASLSIEAYRYVKVGVTA
jgi:elongation factor Ts